MQAMELARICIRIMSVIMILQGITVLPEVGLIWRDYQLDLYTSAWVVLFAVGKLMPLMVGILFWVQTERICRYFVNFSAPKTAMIKISLRQMFSVGLFVVGLLITIQALPDLASHSVALLFKWQIPNASQQSAYQFLWTKSVMACAELLMGIVLMVFAPYVAHWLVTWWPQQTAQPHSSIRN